MVMTTQTRFNRRRVYTALILLIFIWAWKLFGPETVYGYRNYLGSKATSVEISRPGIYEYDKFDPTAIQKVCSATEWTPGLIFTCEESGGGVGNLRNSILHCVRYAIHAGASLVVPRIMKRSDEDTTLIWGQSKVELEWLFDRTHFVDSLHVACPQLPILQTQADIPYHGTVQKSVKVKPESLIEGEVPKTGLEYPEQWRGIFFSWLHNISVPTETEPITVHLDRSYMAYPVHTDGDEFVYNFGKILELRYDARLLASTVLYEMQKTFGLAFDQTDFFFKNAFFGVHLRTELDSQNGWPPGDWEYSRFERQTELYLKQAPRSNSSFIYVASGDEDEIRKFANIARDKLGMLVMTKYDLLEGESLAQLKRMTFDQQALVDYLVLMRASDFAGIAHSSFAWNVALKRHQFSKVTHYLDGPEMLSDELSLIYGQPRGYPEYDACIWP